MRISLYIVLIYLQKQLDILSQTYSLLQRRRRALYLMFLSDGKKKRKTTVQTVAYLERRFWTRPGRKWLTSWSTVNIIWSCACNLNREGWWSNVTMTTTVYQNDFCVERGCKTLWKRYENDSVDGDLFHCGWAFLHLPGLVWMGPGFQFAWLQRLWNICQILQKIPTFHLIAPYSPFLLLHRFGLVCAFACVWRACPGLCVKTLAPIGYHETWLCLSQS